MRLPVFYVRAAALAQGDIARRCFDLQAIASRRRVCMSNLVRDSYGVIARNYSHRG